jgi:hypothetical protein
MRDALYGALQREAKVESRKTFAAFDTMLDQRLRHEIALQVFGPAAALKYDTEVGIAVYHHK